MIKADIVNKVAEVSEISRVKAAQAVDTVIEGLRNALAIEALRARAGGCDLLLACCDASFSSRNTPARSSRRCESNNGVNKSKSTAAP